MDQPVGTGLSYAEKEEDYVKNMDEVAKDFYYALGELYKSDQGCFNELKIAPSQNLFIFGESYAGKYVPEIASLILAESVKDTVWLTLTGLKGIAIGMALRSLI